MKHEKLMKSVIFSDKGRKYYDRVEPDMDDDTACSAINSLCIYLEKYYCEKTIILLDEYDTPMQEAWLGGYWDEAVRFFGIFWAARSRQTRTCAREFPQELQEFQRNLFFPA